MFGAVSLTKRDYFVSLRSYETRANSPHPLPGFWDPMGAPTKRPGTAAIAADEIARARFGGGGGGGEAVGYQRQQSEQLPENEKKMKQPAKHKRRDEVRM